MHEQPDLQASPSLARSGGLIAPALTFVNLAGYVVTIAAAHALHKDAYGELNALLGVTLVVCVPAIALQAVVARSVALRPAGEVRGPRERALLVRSALVGVTTTAVVVAATPLLAAFLHSGLTAPLWVALQLAPFALLSGAMGVLQGAERFHALSAVVVVQGLGKGLGLLPLLGAASPADVLAALAGGTALAAVVAVLLVGRGLPGPGPLQLPRLPELATAASGLLAVLVLANLDLLLARNVLSGNDSGRYGAGAVLSKAAFWLPQAVSVVVFPRLTDSEGGRGLLRRAVLVVVGLGALEVGGCLVLARPVLEVTFGRSYGSLSGIAWLWAAQGALLAVVQLLVYRAIATRDPVPARMVTGAALLEAVVILVLSPGAPRPIVSIAAAAAALLAAVLLLRQRLRDGGPDPA